MIGKLLSNRKNRPALLALGGLVLLLLVAEAAYMYFGQRDGRRPRQVEEEIELVVAPFFVRLEGLNVPVIRNDRVERHLFFDISLEVGDSRARRDVWRALPKLRDAYIRDLMGFLRLVRFEDDPASLKKIKRRLLGVSAKVMGPEVIKAVLVQQLNERRLSRN